MLGFDTVGNATLIAYDGDPVLATDPWIKGSAYFGSWALSHEIPDEQANAVQSARYVWFSHGHPDHLNPDCLPLFKRQQILVPDHVGGRIATHLRSEGFQVRILPHDQWVPLTPSIKVRCLPDRNQDAVLLVDMNGSLVVNVNDSGERGSPELVSVIRQYSRSFLLRPSTYGDTTMINFFDESGRRLPTIPEIQRAAGVKAGERLSNAAKAFGVTDVIPFSAMHRYQRADSAWANAHTTSIEDHYWGFDSTRLRLLPAFVRCDIERDEVTELNPEIAPDSVASPEEFGDNYDETLDPDEVKVIARYFRQIHHVGAYLDFINCRVGGEDNLIQLQTRRFKRGITFEVPRASLIRAVKSEIFDDLLIGNFMRTTLHGQWPSTNLYPDFAPYVGKYADNGQARSKSELKAYFAEYRRRMSFMDYLRSELAGQAVATIRKRIPRESTVHVAAEKCYWMLRRH